MAHYLAIALIHLCGFFTLRAVCGHVRKVRSPSQSRGTRMVSNTHNLILLERAHLSMVQYNLKGGGVRTLCNTNQSVHVHCSHSLTRPRLWPLVCWPNGMLIWRRTETVRALDARCVGRRWPCECVMRHRSSESGPEHEVVPVARRRVGTIDERCRRRCGLRVDPVCKCWGARCRGIYALFLRAGGL